MLLEQGEIKIYYRRIEVVVGMPSMKKSGEKDELVECVCMAVGIVKDDHNIEGENWYDMKIKTFF